MSDQLSFAKKLWSQAPLIQSKEKLYEHILQNKKLKNHEEISDFLSPQMDQLHSPWIMKGMKEAMSRITEAIKKSERIMIFGDFDADGITSTVILVAALKELGAQISYRIPDRNTDSHGIKPHHVDEIASQKVKLIITCDCGVNDLEALQYAFEKKIDVIITDHHTPDENIQKRPVIATINPLMKECSYPEKNLSGAGIAFKLISALAEKYFDNKAEKTNFLHKYIEIATIGIIADCVPLIGENRIITKLGLEQMKTTQWTGLRHFFISNEIDQQNIDEQTIGFAIAPRLNAASRIGDVTIATQLFLGDENQHPARLNQLEHWNKKRKHLTHISLQESHDQVRPKASVQIFVNENWHPGILGLIASKQSETLGVPVIAATLRADGLLAASCRAPEGSHMAQALQSCRQLFTHFGGHAGAAGFVAQPKHLEAIREALDTHFSQQSSIVPSHEVNAFVSSHILDFETIDFLKTIAPFGIGNLEPVFGLQGVTIQDYKIMGTHKNHIRLTLAGESENFQAIAFFAETWINRITSGQIVDILCTVSDSYWQGQRRREVRVVDIRESL